MLLLASLVLASPSPAAATLRPEPAPESVRIEVRGLVLDVHLSRTAQLFHGVDQIARWSPFCHTQYLDAYGELDAEDEARLAEHTAIRRRRSWGQGLEQTFYVPHSLDEALERGVAQGHITAAEAEEERRILLHFAERSDALLERELDHLIAFRARIEKELPLLGELASKLERLIGAKPAPIPVFLLANPSESNFGGGFNGGKLTIEVPGASYDIAFGTFLHELFHAFLDLRSDTMAQAVEGVHELLDVQTFYEGLAHAISPGIHHDHGEDRDVLREMVDRFRQQGQTLNDYGLRVHLYGLHLRPLLQAALDDEAMDFEELSSMAVGVWQVMIEAEAAPKGD